MQWIRLGRFGVLACAAFLLAACGGVHLPDTQAYLDPCPAPRATAETLPGDTLFFVSTSLPDCRDGHLRLAPYRYTDVTYGLSDLSASSAQPWKHHETARYTREAWHAMLDQSLARGDNAGRILVYVHGYNNAYEDALERGFKLSRLYWQGVPVVVFSWPSRNRVQSYGYDESSVVWAQDRLDALLLDLAARSSDITLVAHSMGNRAAIQAALNLDRELGSLPSPLRRIVLASPDVDRDEMLRPQGAIDKLLRIPGRQLLIYGSSADRPLAFSRMQHGYARLGSTACKYDVDRRRREDANCLQIPMRPGLTIVDTSQVNAGDVWRHSDFVDSCAASTDLSQFLRGETPSLREPEPGSATSYTLRRGVAEAQGLCPRKPGPPIP
jgi:esterase/lipase superfamily enzyme